jgi:seryl-tRNA(Sec) selenium transferase
VGRIVKVGREEVVGLIVALRRYLARDPAPDLARWQGIASRVATAIDGVAGVHAEIIAPEGGVPVVAIGFPALAGAASVAAATVIARLRERDPRVWAGEEFVDEGRVALNVQHVRDDEVQIVIDRLREVLTALS